MKPYATSGSHHSNQSDITKWAEWDETRRRARRSPNAERAVRRYLRGKARAANRRAAVEE